MNYNIGNRIWIQFVVVVALSLNLVGCSERTTDDPIESYRLWSGRTPSTDVNVIHGRYWKSAHFTKEYILYMELKVSPKWRDEYLRQNALVQAEDKWVCPQDAPSWFKPPQNYRIWRLPQPYQRSRVFEDGMGHMFIYEIQL